MYETAHQAKLDLRVATRATLRGDRVDPKTARRLTLRPAPPSMA
jgi:hypothetical protein